MLKIMAEPKSFWKIPKMIPTKPKITKKGKDLLLLQKIADKKIMADNLMISAG